MNLPTKSQLLKQNLLKRFCFIMISLLGCINIISCGGDEPEDPQKPITPEQPEETRYYVKYEIEMPSQWINTEKSIRIYICKHFRNINCIFCYRYVKCIIFLVKSINNLRFIWKGSLPTATVNKVLCKGRH